MAYLAHKRDNTWEIRFSVNGRRTQITVSGLTKGNLEVWRENVEHLASARTNRQAPSIEILRWADDLSERLRRKLEGKDLVGPDPRVSDTQEDQEPTLHNFLDSYFEVRKSDVKHSTWTFYMQTTRRLKEFFPAKTKLSEINSMKAMEFRTWLETKSNKREKKKSGISINTVRRRTGLCRQIFAQALEDGYIQRNPFSKMSARVKVNKDNQFYVEREVVLRLIDFIDDPEWKLLVALGRFGALRLPSEVLGLKWSHINFKSKRMLIHQPKVEHHEGRETKIVPLFPEIEPHLLRVKERSKTERVYPKFNEETKLGMRLRGYIVAMNKAEKKKNGANAKIVKPWPKQWQNLRVSGSTDMARTLPAHIATAICGHTEPIARHHYWMVSESDLDRALNIGEVLKEQQKRLIDLDFNAQ